jgi:uncharacterized protein YbjT (DUF2867 family)
MTNSQSNPSKNKSKFNRIIDTLAYFEIIPFLGCLKRILSGNQTSSKTTNSQIKMGTILVAGATGGVGKRVVKTLLDHHYQVKALVQDKAKAQALFGDKVTIYEADITDPSTLTSQIMENVTGVICCTGVKVQPVEGDTPDRAKYYQGVKFYMPQVVGSPEKVEYEGIKNLANLASQNIRKTSERVLFDFKNPAKDVQEAWGALDDIVMGGISESQITLASQRAIFTGNVSTENSGGFVSIRTKNFNPPWDLSGYEGIDLRVQGDGKRYKFIIRCEGKWDGLGYCYSFDTFNNTWMTIRIPFQDLIPVFRAKTVPNAGKFDSSCVYSMQLMLSKFEYDGALNPRFSPGIFGLEIENIKAYGGQAKPQFIMISSAGVTRPGRPNLDLEKEPPAVRMNDQLGGILTWKLKGENALKESGLNYTIIRPCALTENAPDQPLILEQGDNIKGQVSRDNIAQLCVKALENPDATNKTFEVKETDTKGQTNWQNLFKNLS